MEIIAIGSTETGFGLNLPGSLHLFLQSLGDLRNDKRDESKYAASLKSWNLGVTRLKHGDLSTAPKGISNIQWYLKS